MSQTIRSKSDILSLLADNTSNAISAQDLRDAFVSSLNLKGYIYKLEIRNSDSDPDNDIDITTGECADESGIIIMNFDSVLTKRTDATFSAGTNQGGLDTGTIASGWYRVFAISDGTNNDILFSSSATPTMPTNYIHKRRIAWILYDGSTIQKFWQTGNRFDTRNTTELETSATPTSVTSFRLFYVPPDDVIAKIGVFVDNNTASQRRIFLHGYALNIGDNRSESRTMLAQDSASTDLDIRYNFEIPTSGGYIAWRCDNATMDVAIQTDGWIDERLE